MHVFSRRPVPGALLALAALGSIVLLQHERAPARAETLPNVPAGFVLETIAHVNGARELAVAPNGDLLVGTLSPEVKLIRDAEGTAAEPVTFARVGDAPAAGLALAPGTLFIGSQYGLWKVPYHAGDARASEAPVEFAKVRPSGGGGHSTTSLAYANGTLYAAVGSSCNACEESDPTRAAIMRVDVASGALHPIAEHIRNAIALAVNPATGALWAGVAGQDELEKGHPYEIFDPVTAHGDGVVDYGWPTCYENHRAVKAGTDCASQTPERVAFPAYETPIGAAFYAAQPHGAHAFPARYRGGAFVTLHGSWHQPPVPPRVVFVPLHGDDPEKAIDWNDPSTQWSEFVSGFQQPGGSRIGRPAGVATGNDGSLFVADGQTGAIYRIRPR